MIEVKNVSKTLDNMDVLTNVNFAVKRGSIYGLLGSNGAGKTTLLKLVTGILLQDEGDILISHQSVFENPPVKNRIVFIADTLYYFPQYTVKQMANFYRSVYSTWDEKRYEKLKDVFEIDESKKVQKFSKGMQRQVAFWLSFSAMPEILVLDEPIDGLDPVMRRKIKNLIVQDVADRGMTVLISSHNLREIEDICDHIGILHKGEMILEKDLDDLKSDIHKIQVAFKGKTPENLFGNLRVLYKEERGSVLLCIVAGDQEMLTEHFTRSNPVIYDMLPLTLEEIFIYEMGDAGYAIKNILV
ncbi:ABC-2 type transport system ATP-binding protein [Scopulibacillus darangshiensis]|uniref:ABC-2 type transport system ATP-binding protein n=1 Tax=Scopulibacillus darangshiensis TaxID=442528 RepID=A0A4R2P358_9BACL|nr:ABC transporter ATP-binding protein [Scopulibacillus darangshiensis]TCP29160.1 ABC-2 type transport system ATP-binding protein [Scopulibacillus darangshiensis]